MEKPRIWCNKRSKLICRFVEMNLAKTGAARYTFPIPKPFKLCKSERLGDKETRT